MFPFLILDLFGTWTNKINRKMFTFKIHWIVYWSMMSELKTGQAVKVCKSYLSFVVTIQILCTKLQVIFTCSGKCQIDILAGWVHGWAFSKWCFVWQLEYGHSRISSDAPINYLCCIPKFKISVSALLLILIRLPIESMTYLHCHTFTLALLHKCLSMFSYEKH